MSCRVLRSISGLAVPVIVLLSASQQHLLDTIEVDATDLSGILLGVSEGGKILIDVDGGGSGWFVDATPGRNEEFALRQGELAARRFSPAAGRMDLLTVVEHEMGHVAGFDHDIAGDGGLMSDALAAGVRRLPGVFPSLLAGSGNRAGSNGLDGQALATLLAEMSAQSGPNRQRPEDVTPAPVVGGERHGDFLNFGDRRNIAGGPRADRLTDFLNFSRNTASGDKAPGGKVRSALAEFSRRFGHLK